MMSSIQARRWPAVLVLAALALGSLAPLAEAEHNGRGNGKAKRKGRDRDQRVESRARAHGDDGSWSGRDRWVDRSLRDRGYRTGSRGYRTDSRGRGSRSRDVYVEKRVVRDVRPVYRSRTVYRNVYRPSYRHRSPYATYTVWRRSHRGDVFAGFVGGLFLGATLSNRAPYGFAYYDPYCHDTFATLGAYYSHCGGHHHARTVHVIEIAHGYGYDDYNYCSGCRVNYWGSDHSCDHDDDYDDYRYEDD